MVHPPYGQREVNAADGRDDEMGGGVLAKATRCLGLAGWLPSIRIPRFVSVRAAGMDGVRTAKGLGSTKAGQTERTGLPTRNALPQSIPHRVRLHRFQVGFALSPFART